MDYFAVFFLLALGFAVGLSGAAIPGPLLVYTIGESLRRGWRVGFQVILGHAIVEVGIILLIVVGFSGFFSSGFFVKGVSLLGGVVLIAVAASSIVNLGAKKNLEAKKIGYGAVVGGVFFTAFNPTFPLWWLTAGNRMLLEGYRILGQSGMLLVVVGHWLADLGWYALVSSFTAHKKRSLIEGGWYVKVSLALALVLALIGLHFISTAF